MFPREANLNCVASQHGWQTAAFLQQIEKCGSLPGSRYAVLPCHNQRNLILDNNYSPAYNPFMKRDACTMRSRLYIRQQHITP
jgi:hypothetical protein